MVFDGHVLTKASGWSVFYRCFCFYHRSQLSAPTRSKRRDCRSAARPHFQHRQQHTRKRHSPTVDRAPSRDSPGPGHPFASLLASLFSAFLAMLGKWWLNRYLVPPPSATSVATSSPLFIQFYSAYGFLLLPPSHRMFGEARATLVLNPQLRLPPLPPSLAYHVCVGCRPSRARDTPATGWFWWQDPTVAGIA